MSEHTRVGMNGVLVPKPDFGTNNPAYGLAPTHINERLKGISEQIAALADGVTRRDRQLSAMGAQLADIETRSNRIESNQQKTNELFVAIDVRLKAIEKKAKRKR